MTDKQAEESTKYWAIPEGTWNGHRKVTILEVRFQAMERVVLMEIAPYHGTICSYSDCTLSFPWVHYEASAIETLGDRYAKAKKIFGNALFLGKRGVIRDDPSCPSRGFVLKGALYGMKPKSDVRASMTISGDCPEDMRVIIRKSGDVEISTKGEYNHRYLQAARLFYFLQ